MKIRSKIGLPQLIHGDVISGKIAKTVFEDMAASGKTARQIVAEKGVAQVSDPGLWKRKSTDSLRPIRMKPPVSRGP